MVDAPDDKPAGAVTPLLAGALLLGAGQQIFVAVRNPFLADLGFPPSLVPYVQGTGAAAGIVAGLLAARLSPRLRLRAPFVACSLLQGAGFLVQALARDRASFFLGAAIAGLAIQLHTAVAPPALRALTRPDARVRVFSRWSMALTPIAGLLGAALVQPIARLLGPGLRADRWMLALAAFASVCALFAFARIAPIARPSATNAAAGAPRDRRRVALLVGFQALVGLAGGIAVPFLPLHLRLAYGISIDRIAALHGGTMIAGLAAMAAAPWIVRRTSHLGAVIAVHALAVPLFLEFAGTPRLGFALAAYVARHALVSLSAPITQAFYQSQVRGDDAAAVAGYGTTASSLAWAVGSFLAGPLVAAGGSTFRAPMLVTSALYGLATLVALIAFPRLRRAPA
jgi:predicted MFS family arabinose efflux permease